MSPYSRDEFDNIPETSARQGVHRALIENSEPGILPVVLVAAAALMVGLLAFLIIPRALDSEGRQPEAASTASPTHTDTPAPPSAPTESASAPPPNPTSPSVDKTQMVSVYNATTVDKLARKYADRLGDGGWKVDQVDVWEGPKYAKSTVFYRNASMEGTAAALGKDLKMPVELMPHAFDSTIKTPLVVVLTPDAAQ